MKIIYFVRDTGSGEIKIGVARKRQLQEQLRTLQLGNPSELKLLGVIPVRNANALVRELNATFKEAHVRGQWFKPARELEEYIRSRAVLP